MGVAASRNELPLERYYRVTEASVTGVKFGRAIAGRGPSSNRALCIRESGYPPQQESKGERREREAGWLAGRRDEWTMYDDLEVIICGVK